jgi:hypothetical protein
VYGETGYRADF